MAQPASILNSNSQSTDTPYRADGTPLIKAALGEINVGLTDKAGFQAVAQALDGDAWAGDSTSGVSVVAGVERSGATVKSITVDSNGVQQLGQQADDTAFAGNGSVWPSGFKADEVATDSVDEGDIGAARMTLDRKQLVTEYANPAGGATPYHSGPSAASNNATSVKASPGRLYSLTVLNLNGAVRYLKLYDKAAAPTPGSETAKYVIPILAGAVVSLSLGPGMNFAIGIAYALVTGISDTDNTSVSANEHVVELLYA